VLGAASEERREKRQEFHLLADARARIINESFRDVHVEITYLSRYFENSEVVTAQEFETFVRPTTRRSTALVEGWAPLLASAQKDSFVAELRRQGRNDFSVFEKDSQGERVTASGREEYCPIVYVSPQEGHAEEVGFDLLSEPAQRAAIEEAIGTGLVSATTEITSDQAPQGRITIYHPVIKAGQEGPLGVVFYSLAVRPLIEQNRDASGVVDPYVELALFDLGIPGEPRPRVERLDHLGPKTDPVSQANLKRQGFVKQYPLFYFGRSWAIVARPGQAFLAERGTWAAPAAGLAGFLITAMVTLFVGSLRNRAATLEKNVQERTRKLSESETMFRLLVEMSTDGVLLRRDGFITYANAAAARMLRAKEAQDLIGRFYPDLVHAEDREESVSRTSYCAEHKAAAPVREHRLIGLDGETVYVESSGVGFEHDGRVFTMGLFREIGRAHV
jgi:PAS domain S-box-containing protein